MERRCVHCGKTVADQDMLFCPYCGQKLKADAGMGERPDSAEEMKWVEKALAVTSYPERRNILDKGLKEFPDSKALLWERLFVGDPDPRPVKGRMDYSVIKCSALEIYRSPKEFPEEKKQWMRSMIFEDPRLIQTLSMYSDPEMKRKEYLERLCAEYLFIFLEEDNRLMGNLFGFRREKNREKILANPCANIMICMRTDQDLSAEQRDQLANAFYQAFSLRMGGKTEYLDAALAAAEG